MTGPWVRGRATDDLKRMYDAVLAAQLVGIELCADGVDGQHVHREVAATLERAGFPTGVIDGRMQGFFRGTGHGVSLDIHEAPRVSRVCDPLRTGHVVTVEPGLYYLRWGAVRIEDMVLIQPGGCRDLDRVPQDAGALRSSERITREGPAAEDPGGSGGEHALTPGPTEPLPAAADRGRRGSRGAGPPARGGDRAARGLTTPR